MKKLVVLSAVWLYRIPKEKLRRFLDKVILKLDGGVYVSPAIRKVYRVYYGIGGG